MISHLTSISLDPPGYCKPRHNFCFELRMLMKITLYIAAFFHLGQLVNFHVALTDLIKYTVADTQRCYPENRL